MPPLPDTIVPPMTGERIVFRQRARQTGGVLLLADNFVTLAGRSSPTSTRTWRSHSRSSKGRLRSGSTGVETTHGTGDGA